MLDLRHWRFLGSHLITMVRFASMTVWRDIELLYWPFPSLWVRSGSYFSTAENDRIYLCSSGRAGERSGGCKGALASTAASLHDHFSWTTSLGLNRSATTLPRKATTSLGGVTWGKVASYMTKNPGKNKKGLGFCARGRRQIIGWGGSASIYPQRYGPAWDTIASSSAWFRIVFNFLGQGRQIKMLNSLFE